ncbi:MAG TPA: OpgC domain-containing protein [Alphaproteobacteria bacterium]|nr:OpgC domain-containing protein [Alphaproteobacteria bacterium]
MAATDRDLRLDFFRGLSLLFIFLDHIPDNVVSYFTLSNVAFCDAAEVFVFISGFTATFVFGGLMNRYGTTFSAVQILKRCWTLYVAHIFLFVIFIAQVSYTAARFNNPMFLDEMGMAEFLQEPYIAVLKAVVLQFQPEFMNILPLYIVLLLGFALVLPLLRAQPVLVMTASTVLYVAAATLHFNLRKFPEGVWYFNPFAWQFIFLIGAAMALRRIGIQLPALQRRHHLLWLSATIVVVTVAIKLAMTFVYIRTGEFPHVVLRMLYTIGDKTNLEPLRLINFLALAHVTVTVIRRDHPMFRRAWAEPVILCGQNSLHIFCLGIFLAVLSHFLLSEISNGLAAQIIASAGGILVMVGTAYGMSWSKHRARPERERGAAAAAPGSRAIQGGE